MNQAFIDSFNVWRKMLFAIHEAENCHYPFTLIVWRNGVAVPWHD